MRRPTSMLRRRAATTLAAVLATTLLAPAGAAFAAVDYPGADSADVTVVERYRAQAARTASAADEEASLKNFEHVFHFEFPVVPGKPQSVDDQGTDLEFYSPTVARRDANGDKVLDAGGNPVLEQRDFAIVGSYDRGAFVFDITNPDKTTFVTQIECNQRQNDVQIKAFGDRWILALTKDGSGDPCLGQKFPRFGQAGPAGIAVYDVTDPYAITPLFSFRTQGGAHNFTFHPTKPFGYVSTGDLPGGMNHIPIIDFTDLNKPTLANDVPVEGGPHDISFNTDGTRAYVASENNMRVYDSTDPAKPVLLSRSGGPAAYVHGADPTPDGKHLLLTDESLVLGGFFAARTALCPGGGFTVYNIEGANERQPVPVGFGLADYRAPTPDHRACTAHVGRFSPNSKYYVTGWYVAGVRVFDISDPRNPKDVGHAMMPRSEVWAAKFHKGPYVYTGDLGRGFDVYRWTGPKLALPPVG
ncbi:MAG: hypothetical protein M3O86_04145 [Actinomycetota bacterium]|nr:hypothetical protein [Actinomycetota bacterium]